MKDEQFDKELSRLYQQRKSQVITPDINLAEPSKIKKYSPFKLLSIFTVGGFASFGIMAIITHFATPSHEQKAIFTNSSHQVNITDVPPEKVDDKVIVIKPKLPPKPETPALVSEMDVLAPVKNEMQTNSIENIDLSAVQIVKLPHLKEPDFLIKPIYKVMPEFSYKAIQNQQSGAIRLRYEIDNTGSVKNIEVVNSEVSRVLQRSAKKALAKWKYKPSDNVQNSYEIIFEFSPRK